MRPGWVKKHLGEVCESKLGKTLNASTDHGEIRPYLCAVNVKWDAFDLATIKKAPFDADEIKKYSVQKGDLLVCEGGETGRAAIWDKEEPIQYQNALHRIRFKEGTILPRFCLHYLRYLKLSGVLDKEYSHGATILHLVSKSLYSIPIEYPSLPEQQRIVDILDREFAKIDALKANAEKSLQAAKDLFQATLKKELEPKEGWVIKPFGEICDIFDKRRKPISKRDREPGPYPYYGASCIQDYVKDYLFDGRYLLIGEDGAKWGPGDDTAYIVEGKFWVNNHAHIVKARDGFLDDYLRYYIKQLDLNPLVAGAIIPKLTQEKLVALEIPVPSFELQQEIVSKLDNLNDRCNTLQENYQKTLTLCDDLKQSLLRKAFSGEL